MGVVTCCGRDPLLWGLSLAGPGSVFFWKAERPEQSDTPAISAPGFPRWAFHWPGKETIFYYRNQQNKKKRGKLLIYRVKCSASAFIRRMFLPFPSYYSDYFAEICVRDVRRLTQNVHQLLKNLIITTTSTQTKNPVQCRLICNILCEMAKTTKIYVNVYLLLSNMIQY